MYEMRCDVAIIGGGPAGLSAAVAARKEGVSEESFSSVSIPDLASPTLIRN